MKMKITKNFTLPQLIEWAMDNDVRDKMFLTENSYCVGFDRHGFIYFNSNRTMPLYQTFTVEVEEEITEDMVFNNLIHIYKDPENSIYNSSHENVSINDVKSEDYLKTTSVYVLNEDSTLTLVWTKEKGLL